mgnify:CR=1 FL=1
MDISEDIFLKELGVHLRKLREKNGLSQQDLANDSNVPKIQIGRIERGEISTTITTLYKICGALKMEIKELF